MMAIRYLTVLFSLTIIMMMQACGDGGGNTDTSGNLTLSAPTFTDTLNGNSIVSFSATYLPPAGKSPQGVVITIGFTDGNGNVVSTNKTTLNSGSSSVTFTFLATNSSTIGIFASVNDMASSTLIFVPTGGTGAGQALSVSSATTAFLATDAANSIQRIIISGGTAPYSVSSTVPADISAINSTNNLVDISLLKAAISPGTPATAIVTVTDAAGAVVLINVSYFK